jgi:bifunctional enzyme CysN/CysC
VLEFLETVPVPAAVGGEGFILPVQLVLRPDLNFRGYAGTLASGVVQPGDAVTVLPSGLKSRVTRIVSADGDLDQAFAPQAITLCLEDEIDISRGDMLVGGEHGLQVARRIEAEIVWLSPQPLQPGRQYLIKHGARSVSGAVDQVHHRLNMDTLEDELCSNLEVNDVGRVTLSLNRPLVCCPYRQSREAGSFIIIDRQTNATLGAGMIRSGKADTEASQVDLKRRIPAEERAARFSQQPCVVWISGRHGIGKMEVAHLLERRLFDAGHLPYALDLYRLPRIAIPAFGEDVHRILDHVDQCLDMGYVCILACTMPQVADRRRARSHLLKRLPVGALVDVYLDAPRETCLRRITADGRDQRLCEVAYEEPTSDTRPDLRLDAHDLQTVDLERIVDQLTGLLQERRLIR